jgi:hypothetical protein
LAHQLSPGLDIRHLPDITGNPDVLFSLQKKQNSLALVSTLAFQSDRQKLSDLLWKRDNQRIYRRFPAYLFLCYAFFEEKQIYYTGELIGTHFLDATGCHHHPPSAEYLCIDSKSKPSG